MEEVEVAVESVVGVLAWVSVVSADIIANVEIRTKNDNAITNPLFMILSMKKG